MLRLLTTFIKTIFGGKGDGVYFTLPIDIYIYIM